MVGALERDAHSLHLAVDHTCATTRDDNSFGWRHEQLTLVAGMNEVEREARLRRIGSVAGDGLEQIVGPSQIHVGVEFGYTDGRARDDGGSLICLEIRRWFRCRSNHSCSVSAGRRRRIRMVRHPAIIR